METPDGGRGALAGTSRLFAGEIAGLDRCADGRFRSVTGDPVERLFFAGALTHVGTRGGRVHARVADPTGTVQVVAGRREPGQAAALTAIAPPAFITVTGVPGLLEGRVAIIPEAVVRTDRAVRDLWVLRTADLTLFRIERAVDAGENGDALVALARMVHEALRTVSDSPVAPPPDVRSLLISILEDAPGRRIAEEDLFAAAAVRGVERVAAESALEELMEEGECYMPSSGQVRLI
ncbi:hypothetical protein [Methanofollis fontis]|uniref:DNA-binding protein n=1 Tax=Methanofollis fontis TaxID=2052832 RepID=A0A483CTB3_9EURY|nr:hypothetical protein [Methanofollis fontis]TAJ44583.1 hypothetical protein CUJ86_04540 [Methanofollis fontis]